MEIAHLKSLLHEGLAPLLTGRCVLLDCPYYANVGDTLIWQGTLDFLHAHGQSLEGFGSLHTWDFRALDEDVVVLLSGGGSFGDLWRPLQEFRLRVVEAYPLNRIVILPQTVFYEDAGLLVSDLATLLRHHSLTVCVRDERSLTLLSGRLPDVLLLPDMAFCISELPSFGAPRRSRLLLQRRDKEAADVGAEAFPSAAGVSGGAVSAPVGGEIRDWPPLEHTGWDVWILYKLSGLAAGRAGTSVVRGCSGAGGAVKRSAGRRWPGRLFARMADRWAFRVVRPRNIASGVRLLARYETICSTRLHGAILALLMHRRVVLLDNSYGKNSSFAKTWGLLTSNS